MRSAELRRWSLLLLLVGPACARDLGLDRQRFRCESDQDCIRSTVCEPVTRVCRAPADIADASAARDGGPDTDAAGAPDALGGPHDAGVPEAGPPVEIAWGTETSTRVDWWWYRGLDAAELDARLAQHQARVVDLEIESTEPQWRYTAVLVDNSGAAHVDALWVGEVTRDQLTLGGRRMIDVELAVTGTVVRFAAVGIDNSGPRRIGWWWYWDASSASIERVRAERDAELLDVNRYTHDGLKLAAVLIPRRSAQTTWHEGQSPIDLARLVTEEDVGFTALEVEGAGDTFTVGVASCPCVRGALVYDVDADTLSARAVSTSMRIARVVRYVRRGEVRFAALLTDDSG